MRILVCGGRDYHDANAVFDELHKLASEHGHLIIIEGGAAGADLFAQGWAEQYLHGLITERADWRKHGRSAGPIRNAKMLSEHKPDLVLAFPSPVRGLVDPRTGDNTGTGDMVQRARDAGVEVRVFETKKGLGLC